MQYLYTIIKADYLQRTRSYSFLITLAVTLFIAYAFIPAQDAGYTTLSASGYKGAYNSAWVGYVSGIMTTVMLTYYGFLLVNSGIKKDIETEVGLIIATSPISNFRYLLGKQLSNYMVLLTIAGVTFVVSIAMFFFRGVGYPFIWSNFLLPYLFFAVPALFLVSSLAVVGEVFLRKRSVLQFIAYFALCGICMSLINNKSGVEPSGFFDPFGLNLITKSVVNHINTLYNEQIQDVSFGFIFNGQKSYKIFEWEGLNWTAAFMLSRLLWMGFGVLLIFISAKFFHRFDFRQSTKVSNKKKGIPAVVSVTPVNQHLEISRATLPPIEFDYGIFSFVKTELLLLIRQGNKWLWVFNFGLWVAMCFVPLAIAHAYLLPILLFLQVTRWSELATKENTNRVHYFAFASYQPLQRLLPAQILSGIVLAIALSLPVMVRSVLNGDGIAVINIVNGAALVVLLAVALGIASGGKKLFEILFFFLTYSVLNKVPVTDYLGSLPESKTVFFVMVVLAINLLLLAISVVKRRYEIRHL
ncbi:MAG: hypothetical protein EOO42_11000 [Flavobacteriales bacterium]|nr:MAG: hypothetical protein EOO42_11000 [Flavobacteriales bacterium]